MSSANKGEKSVRFAANVAPSSSSARQKRNVASSISNEEDHNDHDGGGGRRRHKRPRLERPNEDEADDVDDWDEQQDDDDADDPTRQLLNAKRKRRERHHLQEDENDDEEEETRIDAKTSLFAENSNKGNDDGEVAIEPFNMDAEQTDGTGYFEGDTFVFRKRGADEEPDAWVESLGDDNDNIKQVAVASMPERMDEEVEGGISMDDLKKEDLYAKIIPLVGDKETVLQAVARYGGLLKRQKTTNHGGTIPANDSSTQVARNALNDLTEAANALMLKGDVDIYQQSRNDLMKLLPETMPSSTTQTNGKQVVSWEYRGNQDGQIHGPYTTAQMLSWTQAGYFVGSQAVQTRTIRVQDKSTVDDLLSDLMDDEDEEPEHVKGEWQSSNEVDFTLYS